MTKHPHIWEGEGNPTKGGISCKLCHARWSKSESNSECAERGAKAEAREKGAA